MKTMKRLGSTLAAGAVAMSLLLGASAAQAAIIDFGTDNVDLGSPGDTYAEDGFVFEVLSGSEFDIRNVAGNPPSSLFVGSNTAAEIGDTISVTATGPQDLFNFFAVDYAARGISTPGDPSDSVNLLGFVDGVQTEAASNISSNTTTWATLVPIWDPIDELRIVVSGQGDDTLLLDNFNVTVVPVPAAVWLLGSGLVALGAVARRRKQTA